MQKPKRGIGIAVCLLFTMAVVSLAQQGGEMKGRAGWNKLSEPIRALLTAQKLMIDPMAAADPVNRMQTQILRMKSREEGDIIKETRGEGFSPSFTTQKLETAGLPENGLVDPDVQNRWGNPPYPVLKCNIKTRKGFLPKAGLNMKIRSSAEFQGNLILNVEIPLQEIEQVAEIPEIQRIEAVPTRDLHNDLGANGTSASRLRLWGVDNYTLGYTGKNVIVGMIDSGADWTHGDFIDPATNTTRILYYWDTAATTGPTPATLFGGNLAGLNYGTVYTKAQIDGGALPATARDTNGHGTHTAGTAAGNGHATGNYTGMAPNSDIIIVKGLDNNGILFIYEMAARAGKPCSVNMSYGPTYPIHYMTYLTDSFPGDGTCLDSQLIAGWNNTYGGGHVPVKSMGNMGHWPTYTGSTPYKIGGWHAGGPINTVQNYTFNMYDFYPYWMTRWGYYPYYTASNNHRFPTVEFGIWYDSPVQITLTAPNGDVFGPLLHGTTGTINNTSAQLQYVLNRPANPNNGAFTGFFYFQYGATTGPWAYSLQPGNWTVRVEPATGGGPGYCDMWVAEYYYRNASYYFMNTAEVYSTFRDGATPSGHLSMYCMDEGASPYEIGVGAWNSRESWTSTNGGIYSWTSRPILNHIAAFSSPGPARNRFLKPDIAAPGNIILSALSSATAPAPNVALIAPGGLHRAMSGTSMSAPHVTGGVAMIMEKFRDQGRPWPTVDRVRQLLGEWALNDAQTAFAGPNAFGLGKMDLLPLNEAPTASITSDRNELILDNIESASLTGRATDYERFPLSHEWALLTQPAGSSPIFTSSGTTARLQPDPEIEGNYQIGFTSHDGIYPSPQAIYTITARFYPVLPPSGFTVERLTNDFIFYKEYVNRLHWAANSENRTEITKYLLYRKNKGAPDSAYQKIQELSPTVFQYEERGLKPDQLYTYRITSVNKRGKESDPVTAGN